jgi:hypothetical protein
MSRLPLPRYCRKESRHKSMLRLPSYCRKEDRVMSRLPLPSYCRKENRHRSMLPLPSYCRKKEYRHRPGLPLLGIIKVDPVQSIYSLAIVRVCYLHVFHNLKLAQLAKICYVSVWLHLEMHTRHLPQILQAQNIQALYQRVSYSDRKSYARLVHRSQNRQSRCSLQQKNANQLFHDQIQNLPEQSCTKSKNILRDGQHQVVILAHLVGILFIKQEHQGHGYHRCLPLITHHKKNDGHQGSNRSPLDHLLHCPHRVQPPASASACFMIITSSSPVNMIVSLQVPWGDPTSRHKEIRYYSVITSLTVLRQHNHQQEEWYSLLPLQKLQESYVDKNQVMVSVSFLASTASSYLTLGPVMQQIPQLEKDNPEAHHNEKNHLHHGPPLHQLQAAEGVSEVYQQKTGKALVDKSSSNRVIKLHGPGMNQFSKIRINDKVLTFVGNG